MFLATQTNSAPFGAQTDRIASCMRAHAHGGPGNVQVLEIRNGKVQFSMNIVGAGSPAVLYVNARYAMIMINVNAMIMINGRENPSAQPAVYPKNRRRAIGTTLPG